MKAITYIATLILMIPLMAFAEKKVEGDTVIIELNGNSKIVIITKNKADLKEIQNYDINQMIKDLNNQLQDSVAYLVIDGDDKGIEYVDENDDGEVTYRSRHDVSVDLGGLSVEVDPDELDDFDYINTHLNGEYGRIDEGFTKSEHLLADKKKKEGFDNEVDDNEEGFAIEEDEDPAKPF